MNTGLLFTIPADFKLCALATRSIKIFFQQICNLSQSNTSDFLEFGILFYISLQGAVCRRFLLHLFS